MRIYTPRRDFRCRKPSRRITSSPNCRCIIFSSPLNQKLNSNEIQIQNIWRKICTIMCVGMQSFRIIRIPKRTFVYVNEIFHASKTLKKKKITHFENMTFCWFIAQIQLAINRHRLLIMLKVSHLNMPLQQRLVCCVKHKQVHHRCLDILK